MYAQKPDFKNDTLFKENNFQQDQNYLNPPLTKVNLRANQLRGSIILGNYGVSNMFKKHKICTNLLFPNSI